MNCPSMNFTARYRIIRDKLFAWLVAAIVLAAVSPLVLILYYIFKNGFNVINWGFLTELPSPAGESIGGIGNAIAGTGLLVGLAGLLAIPLGITAGIFLAEYRETRLATLAGLCLDTLAGIPSIVIGMVAYIWIVLPMNGFSALSGGVALAVMMLPMVVKATAETLKLVPHSLKEAALALGVPYYRTVLRVIVPAGRTGIITGILLGIARVSGETAPLLFTAFGSPFMNANILKPVSSLPLLIFNYAASPYEEWHAAAWGASLVLVTMVLALNLCAKLGERTWKNR